MTTELEVEKSPPLALALRPQYKGRTIALALWPQYKGRTSGPWPWADGQQRGVVEGKKI